MENFKVQNCLQFYAHLLKKKKGGGRLNPSNFLVLHFLFWLSFPFSFWECLKSMFNIKLYKEVEEH